MGPSVPISQANSFANGTLLAPAELINTLNVQLSDCYKADLDRLFHEKEVERAVFQMSGFKAPGPDGFISAFYKKNWDVVGGDVSRVVLSFLHYGVMLKEINHTYTP